MLHDLCAPRGRISQTPRSPIHVELLTWSSSYTEANARNSRSSRELAVYLCNASQSKTNHISNLVFMGWVNGHFFPFRQRHPRLPDCAIGKGSINRKHSRLGENMKFILHLSNGGNEKESRMTPTPCTKANRRPPIPTQSHAPNAIKICPIILQKQNHTSESSSEDIVTARAPVLLVLR